MQVPHCDWNTLSEELHLCLQRGYDSCVDRPLKAGPGLRVMVVESEVALQQGLELLRDSMQDAIVAIDLEWKPDLDACKPISKVALMQLASSSVCLLVRISCLGFRMPDCLRNFLRDPSVVTVGYSWDSADERKSRSTFDFGRSDFGRFVDLQSVSQQLGYHGYGLAGMCQRVLGFQLNKCKTVSRSNWQARVLTPRQLQYAALDSLVAGHLFRGVRLWHSSPSECAGCQQLLGNHVLPTGGGRMECPDPSCARSFDSLERWFNHVGGAHGGGGQCADCGRIRSTHRRSSKKARRTKALGSVPGGLQAADGLWINAAVA